MTVKPYFYLKRTALLSSITFTTSAIAVGSTIVVVGHLGYFAAAPMTIAAYAVIVVIGYCFSLTLEPAPFALHRRLGPVLMCSSLAFFVYAFETPLWTRIVLAALLVAAALHQVVKALRLLQSGQAFQT